MSALTTTYHKTLGSTVPLDLAEAQRAGKCWPKVSHQASIKNSWHYFGQLVSACKPRSPRSDRRPRTYVPLTG